MILFKPLAKSKPSAHESAVGGGEGAVTGIAQVLGQGKPPAGQTIPRTHEAVDGRIERREDRHVRR